MTHPSWLKDTLNVLFFAHKKLTILLYNKKDIHFSFIQFSRTLHTRISLNIDILAKVLSENKIIETLSFPMDSK